MNVTHSCTPFDRVNDLENLATAVRLMRQRQKEYFEDRTRERLTAAKRAEKAVDNALTVLDSTGAGMRPLFPISGP